MTSWWPPRCSIGPQIVEDVIGYYGNTVAMRLRPQRTPDLPRDARRTPATPRSARSPISASNLDRVVRELNPDRRHGAERMTRVSFGSRGADGDGLQSAGYHLRARRSARAVHPAATGIHGRVRRSAGAWWRPNTSSRCSTTALARQLLEHYAVLLDSALADPDRPIGELDLMGPADADWLRRVSTGEEFSTPATTLAALVEAQVARTPDAVAVVYEGRHYTYREINESANRLAHWLIGQGIGTEDRVAVLLDRSPELGDHRARRDQGGRGVPAGRPDLSGGPAELHPVRLRSETGAARIRHRISTASARQSHRRRPGPPAAARTTPPT